MMGDQAGPVTGAGKGIDAETRVSPLTDCGNAEAGDCSGALQAAMERTERREVRKALARANGNVAEAAAMLRILRTSLYRIMKRYGIATPTQARSEDRPGPPE